MLRTALPDSISRSGFPSRFAYGPDVTHSANSACMRSVSPCGPAIRLMESAPLRSDASRMGMCSMGQKSCLDPRLSIHIPAPAYPRQL